MTVMIPDERYASSTVTNRPGQTQKRSATPNTDYDENGPYGPHVESERVKAIKTFIKEINPTIFVDMREKLYPERE